MNTPSIKTLINLGVDRERAKLAKFALTHDAKQILQSGKFPSTDKWYHSCYNPPKDYDVIMHACDEALGTYGVEHVSGRNGRSLEYCNAGDTYTVTLCFEFSRGLFGGRMLNRVFIGCYGDWVERYGKREIE